MKFWFRITIALAISAMSMTMALAQDSSAADRLAYYAAADANGVQQVYQLLLNGESKARQVTQAASDVETFGVAYDGLSIAYISGGQLWLQPIHTEEAEALTTISTTQYFSSPVYSQDGQYIAYGDNGLWLLDLATRETQQLLQDVPVAEDGSNMADFRIYQPDVFVAGAEGHAEKLILKVGIWEWQTTGVYDLASGELQVLDDQVHTSLLPLSDGRALLYGNGGIAGEMALHIAESLNDINQYTELVAFSAVTDATLFAEQAVEVAPGIVRVFGQTISPNPNEASAFSFDYDLMAGTAGEIHLLPMPLSSAGASIAGQLSPDGSLFPAYQDAMWTETGRLYGAVTIHDAVTGDAVEATLPETVSIFRWGK